MSPRDPDALPPLDWNALRFEPLEGRPSKVALSHLGRPEASASGIGDWLDSLPDVLAARGLKRLRDAVVRAHRGGRPVVAALGGHVIKTGCGPYLVDWVRRGVLNGLALNGSAAVHDLELAVAGRTSEDVGARLMAGEFGFARETSELFALACERASARSGGLGASLGAVVEEHGGPGLDQSVLVAARRAGVPLTVHVAIGTDIVHMTPRLDGAALGRATLADFRTLCDLVSRMEGGVWLNLGSAVVLPEVFLKAVSVARNLGRSLDGLTTANLDFEQKYRGLLNVLQRPGAEGVALTGHHELMIPLLHAAVSAVLSDPGGAGLTIVVFCPNLVGDTVMATPVLRALRGAYPAARIVGVVKPHVAPTLDGTAWLDDLILHDPKARDRRHRTRAARGRLRHERADLAVLLPNSFRSAWLAWAAGIRRRVGYSRGGRGLLLTDRLAVPRDPAGKRLPVPAVDYYLALVRHLGVKVGSARTELATTPGDEAAADRAWAGLGLGADRPVVCFNTGGAFGPAKSWPVAYFSALGRRLVEEAGARVLVVCGPGERAAARQIVAGADHPFVVSLADQELGLGLTKACVRRSALMVTTDSGPRHFAGAFGVPVVSLFGPTHIAWTRTYHPMAVHLLHPVPCGPCQKPVCPLGHHRCMTELTPDAVFRAAVRMLPGRPAAVA